MYHCIPNIRKGRIFLLDIFYHPFWDKHNSTLYYCSTLLRTTRRLQFHHGLLHLVLHKYTEQYLD